VNGQPNWRLELVVTNPATRLLADSHQVLRPSEIEERIGDAETLSRVGRQASAMVLIWSAAEATLRLTARRHGVALRRDDPQHIVTQLTVLGDLGRAEYEVLHSAAAARDAVVHGFAWDPPSPDLVHQVAVITRRLLRNCADLAAAPAATPADGPVVGRSKAPAPPDAHAQAQ
jgi:hypothetical protein